MYEHGKKAEPSAKTETKAPSKAAASPNPTRQPAWTNALGSQPVPALQPKLTVNQSGDEYEQEADRVAAQVMRMASPAVIQVQRCACGGIAGPDGECAACKAKRLGLQRQTAKPEEEQEEKPALQTNQAASPMLQRKPSGGASSNEAPSSVHETLRSSGQPLHGPTRERMERSFGQDFSRVRVHTSRQAEQSAVDVGAHAYTVGNNLAFATGAYAPGTTHGDTLIAHELTHVVQQRQGISLDSVQRAGDDESFWDKTKRVAGAAVDTVADAGNAIADTASSAASAVTDVGWTGFELIAPKELVAIARNIQQYGGIFNYIEHLLQNSFTSILDSLQNDSGLVGELTQTFVGLFARAQIILEALKTGDCGPLFAALDEMKAIAEQLAGDAWTAITDFFRPIGNFFSDLWKRFGAPALDWLTSVASGAWETIKSVGLKIWSLTAPIRESYAQLWKWFKELLFGPSNPDTGESSGGGFVDYLKQEAADAWESIKIKLEPVIAPIRAFAQKIMSFIPLDKIMKLRDTIINWTDNIQQMTQNMGKPDDIAANQISLRDEILPAVLQRIAEFRNGLIGTGQWIAANIGDIAASATAFLTSLQTNELLSPLAGALTWVQDGINGVTTWAQSNVVDLFTTIGDGLVSLSHFIKPVLDTLQQLVDVVSDLAGNLGGFVQGIWNRIPACIREPIENFIKEQIFAKIPIFAQLMEVPDLWKKLTGTVKLILKQVFVDGDLLGAAWTFFRSVLAILDIPEDLVLNIVSKAAKSIGDILKDPVGFLMNLIKSIKAGFGKFVDNLAANLMAGFGDWLSGELGKANVTPPPDLSFKSILTWVMEVLGITIDNVFERMSKHPRIGPQRSKKLRKVFDMATGAIRWIYKLVTEGPGAVWEDIKDQLSDLWTNILGGIMTWLTEEVAKKALIKLISTFADPTGIMAAVNTIITVYEVIKSVAQYMRQILETVNTVLDGIVEVIAGAIETAAGWVEKGLVKIIPIAIGFLLNILGLDGAGDAIKDVIEKLREKVNQAIDWLINKGLELIDKLLGKKDEEKDEENDKEIHFDAGGKQHRIYLEAGEIMSNPNPHPLSKELDEYESNDHEIIRHSLPEASEREEVKKEIKYARIEIKNATSSSKLTPTMKTHMKTIYTFLGHPTVKPTEIEFRAGGNWTTATADPLTLKVGTVKGEGKIKGSKRTSAGKKEAGWDIASRLNRTKDDKWVNAHLIHFNLHGPNDTRNFAIADKSANGQMYKQVEELAINALSDVQYEGKLVMKYKTTVTYYDENGKNDYSDFAKTIATRFEYFDGKKKVVVDESFKSEDPAIDDK